MAEIPVVVSREAPAAVGVAGKEKELIKKDKMGKRISFSDPVKLVVIYGSATVNMIAERETYKELWNAVNSIDAPAWITIRGMLNDFDANATEICINVESIISIEYVEVNS